MHTKKDFNFFLHLNNHLWDCTKFTGRASSDEKFENCWNMAIIYNSITLLNPECINHFCNLQFSYKMSVLYLSITYLNPEYV